MSIEQAEELREDLANRLEQMKEDSSDMKSASWGYEEGVIMSGNQAGFLFGLLCEWIETTKDLLAGPAVAADVNETNAARVQTLMKYRFVRVPKDKCVVCIPAEEYEVLLDVYKFALLGAIGPKFGEAKELARSRFYDACAEYPPAVYLDFE